LASSTTAVATNSAPLVLSHHQGVYVGLERIVHVVGVEVDELFAKLDRIGD
jgi:hypothetical protein